MLNQDLPWLSVIPLGTNHGQFILYTQISRFQRRSWGELNFQKMLTVYQQIFLVTKCNIRKNPVDGSIGKPLFMAQISTAFIIKCIKLLSRSAWQFASFKGKLLDCMLQSVYLHTWSSDPEMDPIFHCNEAQETFILPITALKRIDLYHVLL